MTALLSRILGRIPVGWLQLTHRPGRLAAALAGVAFANILVFVQLGIMGSLNQTIRDSYSLFRADLMISAADANTLTDGSNVARQWMFRALSDPGVAEAAAMYFGRTDWTHADGEARLQVIGIAPDRADFLAPDVARRSEPFRLPDAGLVDLGTRGVDSATLAGIRPQSPLRTELAGQRFVFAGTFTLGASFGADGYMVTSDQSFLRLFQSRDAGAPDHILLRTASGQPPATVAARLAEALPGDVLVRPLRAAAEADVTYQNTERPTGLIFGFGVLMGVIVGLVIVYQVLSSDVADHLREYATFKAMGYGPGFFFGVIFEEAVVLALLGFGPGIVASGVIYGFLEEATGLPLTLSAETAVLVFLGTLAASTVSGALAARRLNAADPADLF